jgi:hypothetical protein
VWDIYPERGRVKGSNCLRAPTSKVVAREGSSDALPSNVGSLTRGSVTHTSVRVPHVRGLPIPVAEGDLGLSYFIPI